MKCVATFIQPDIHAKVATEMRFVPKTHDTHAARSKDHRSRIDQSRFAMGTGVSNQMTAAEESFERDSIIENLRFPTTLETILYELPDVF